MQSWLRSSRSRQVVAADSRSGSSGRRRSFGPEVVVDVPPSTVGLLRRGPAECERLPLSKCRPRTSGTGRTWPSHPGRRDAGTPERRNAGTPGRRDAATPGRRGHEDVDAAAGRPVSVVRGSPVPDLIRRRGRAPADRAGKAHGEGHRSGDAACSSGALSARGLRPHRSLPTLTSGRWPPGARPRGTVPTHRLRTRRPARACPRRPPCRHRLPRRVRGR